MPVSFADFLKAVLLGLIEGIAEWLPISSTGHILLFDDLLRLGVSPAFREMFVVVIQFFAVLAVPTLYGDRLFGFLARGRGSASRAGSLRLWKAILIATLPAAVLGALFDGVIDRYLFRPVVVGAALVVYGVAFLVAERRPVAPRVSDAAGIGAKPALCIGLFQVLSLVPGTSRSGATILGGLAVGVSRKAAAEFSFFLALPVMLGASGFKLAKFLLSGVGATAGELLLLAVGSIVAYLTSLFILRALTSFVARHSFRPFAWYRILLGAIVLFRFFLVSR